MERREPVLEPTHKKSGQDWGNLNFRRRRPASSLGTPDDNAESRFWIGVGIFLLVAVLHPWYSYWVNTRLLGWELESAGEEISRQLDAANEQMRQEAAAVASRREAVSRRQRISGVRVVGAVPSRTGPVAIVRLGQSNVSEAKATICRQAEEMLGMPLSGEILRVQQHRGGQSTMDAGTIRC